MTAEATHAVTGSFVLGRYRIGEQIGQGGMGGVYAAHDDVLQREVAIKVLKTEVAADPEILERFRREALIAARLSHAGIAQIIDFAEENGRPYLVMELLKGRDLAQILAGEGRLEPDRAAGIAAQVAEALHHAHEQGAVHRDVKPGNIFITETGAVKVTDFGIATAAEQAPLTKTGDILGTAFYLSPEQVRGQPATPSSDVYALGCVLFEMVTGRPPFSAETSVATAMARLDKPAPPVRDAAPDVPSALESVIRRALDPEPSARFESAADLARELSRISSPVTSSMTQPIGSETQVLPGAQVLAAAPALEKPVEKLKEAVRPDKPQWKAVAALAAGLLILLLLARACMDRPQTAREVSAPNLVSLSFEQASAQLERQGLRAERRGEELSDQPAGRVFRQDPAPGEPVPDGSAVGLWVSAGKGTRVPDLVNLSVEQAADKLREAGLTGVVTDRVAGPRTGIITAQDPPGGTMTAAGGRISLTITVASGGEAREGRDGEDGEPGKRGERGDKGKGGGKGDD